MPESGRDIQLLSGSRRKLSIKTPGENKPIYVGAVFVLIALAISGATYFYFSKLNLDLSAINDEIISLERQRDKDAENRLLVLNQQLSLAGGLVDNHLVWSEALGRINQLTPPEVQFSSLIANVSGEKIDILAVAPSYTVIARQISSLLSDQNFKDVNIGKISTLPSGSFEYGLQIVFNSKKLLKPLNPSDQKVKKSDNS